MKNESEQVQRWDDIIFEKRNKDYGAYAIRKSYNDSVLKAEALSIGLGILIFVVPILLPKEHTVPPIFEEKKGEIVLKDFEIKTENPPPNVMPPRRIDASIIPTRVTTQPVIEEPPVEPETDEVSYTTGPDNGTSTATGTDVSVGTGTEPVVEPPRPEWVLSPEVMPEFEGGYEGMMQFLQKKLRYPSSARRRHDEGIVYVSFVISASGSVTHVELIRGITKDLDQEAMRVISLMDKWKPGLQNKMPVAVKMVLPIKFKLSD